MTIINKEIKTIIGYVDTFRSYQNLDGSIEDNNHSVCNQLLERIVPLVQATYKKMEKPELADAFVSDVSSWQQSGLNNKPDFTTVRTCFTTPDNGEHAFFIGVCQSQNSYPRGYFLECFYILREEPQECVALYNLYPHPKNICQSTKLIEGSEGISKGNCVVFFPESIAAKEKIKIQKYAIFFFNKFKRIYESESLIKTNEYVANLNELANQNLWHDFETYSDEDVYKARCVWGYLHDYFHHQGDRPFDENIYLKMNWFVGVLEEIKVDLQTFLVCRTEDFWGNHIVAQFIIYDRMFRYPFQKDGATNFDSATGYVLFNWLKKLGVINIDGDTVSIDGDKINDGASQIIAQIQSIEKMEQNKEIKEAAFDIVNSYISVSKDKKIVDFGAYSTLLNIA